MKFVSKNVNLCVVLKPSIPAEPLAGRTATPGVYARFENGVLSVNDANMVELLKTHPSFNRDFIAVEDAEDAQIHSFLANQNNKEPEHNIINMEYGHPGKSIGRASPPLTPELKKVVTDAAVQMAKELTAELTKTTLAEVAKLREELAALTGSKEENKKPSVNKGGRPKKVEVQPENENMDTAETGN